MMSLWMLQVLPLYIVVMLAHGTTEAVVVENLEAFLGEHAQAFTTWCTGFQGFRARCMNEFKVVKWDI